MAVYDSYKDSGVKWIGQIPSHWDVTRTKNLWQETFCISENGSEQLLSVSQYDGVVPSKEKSRSESLKGYKIVSKDSLVINIMLAWLGGLGVSKYEGVVSPAYCVYKLKHSENANPQFLHYLYKTPMYLAEFARHSTGIVPSRWRMYTDEFGRVLSILPPLSEQTAIAEYLDKETAKIDTAIAQQQKMIDLLNERKQIIINQAVTKGLDPNAKMKDSGVDWIGEIPAEWEILPMKYCMKLKNGADYKKFSSESGYPVIGSGGQFAYSSRYTYDGEVVFFGRKGTIDKPLYFKGKFWAVDTMFYAIPKSNIVGKYLFYQGLTIPYKYYSTSTALPSMTQTDLGNNPICLPSIEQQRQIIDLIEAKCTPVDKAIINAKQLIVLLQERKQILINEVVTGKVKVC